jgi:hypothetical protein
MKLEKMDLENRNDYAAAREQINAMERFSFGAQITVLLVTNRLPGCAMGLQEYLQNSTDIAVELVETYEEARAVINAKPLDFLIFVGYQKAHDNYRAKELFERFNKYSTTVIFAVPTPVIESHSQIYKIKSVFDRRKSLARFVVFMKERYEAENYLLKHDYPDGITREQHHTETIKAVECEHQAMLDRRAELRHSEEMKTLRGKILSYVGIGALALLVVGFMIWEINQPRESGYSAEFRYVIDNRDEAIIISAQADEDSVTIELTKTSSADNSVLYEATWTLTLEEAREQRLVYRRTSMFFRFQQPPQDKGYIFNSNNLLTYSLMEILADAR